MVVDPVTRLDAIVRRTRQWRYRILVEAENVPISASDISALVDFAEQLQIDLTVVGPEAPLVDGIADTFQDAGRRVFGPTQKAAQIEGSKAFSKQFMQRHNIPTGSAEIFQNADTALAYLDNLEHVPVIKASGLAAGKGVILPETMQEAKNTLHAIMTERQFGVAGDTVLIEERMDGPEVSVLAFCDGESVIVMPAAQDHKRLLDNDEGPNTGGMGAFAPAPLATPELLELALQDVLLPTVRGLAAEGSPYVGILYAGLMLTGDGAKVLEFNCRFGDPETQVILPLLESNLLAVMDACVDGRLGDMSLDWRNSAAATVVAASGGYPGDYATGKPISGIKQAEARGGAVLPRRHRRQGRRTVHRWRARIGGYRHRRELAVGHRSCLCRYERNSLQRHPLPHGYRPYRRGDTVGTDANMPRRDDISSILIIGSGPIVIGQACEFDYSGAQACKALRQEGYRVVLVNSNPATIMTDPEMADATYVEPLTVEVLEKIIEKEKPDALLPTVGGQTGLNLSVALAEAGVLDRHGVELIGANLRVHADCRGP